jgi:Putative peptidoglycan binding domain
MIGAPSGAVDRMTLWRMLRPGLAGLIAVYCLASPPRAAAADADALKTAIEVFLHRAEASADGHLRWDGADSFTVKTSGDAAVATLVNAHFSLRKAPDDAKPLASFTLDRIEISRKPAAQGGKFDDLAVVLPALVTFVTGDGREVDLTLKDGHASALLEGPGDRQRAAAMSFAEARVEDKGDKGTGGQDWARFGPLNTSWKTVRNDDGSWHNPIDFELKGLEFLIAEAPLAGRVERVAYTADATGPSLAALDELRDRMAEIRDEAKSHPEKAGAAWLPVLSKLLAVFNTSKGDLTVEQASAKRPDGETLMTLAKARMAGTIAGLDGDSATLRFSLGHEGLTLAPSLVPAAQVPRRADLDFGFEKIAMSVLRTICDAAAKGGPDASDADRQAANSQMLVAAMALSPVFHIYDASVEFPDVAVSASGEAHRAPPLPIGYAATGDLSVRGFDALSEVLTSRFDRALLPLVKFIGHAAADAGGHPVTRFALTSAIGRWIEVNGSNLANWSGAPPSGAQRLLRLADPPLRGDDVTAVQKAVADNRVEPFTDGVYDTATALAVARFQKGAGLNVDGTVDAATRDKLGLKPHPAVPDASKQTSQTAARKIDSARSRELSPLRPGAFR